MLDFRQSLINSTRSKALKRLYYRLEVMLTCVRWYVAYPLSLRHVEEVMQDRGVFVYHSTVQRLGSQSFASSGGSLSQTKTTRGLKLADG